ncbi:hypothetical protein D6D04_08497, partial [Aureobasidium pullulans]
LFTNISALLLAVLDIIIRLHARSRLSRSRNHHQASAERQKSYHLLRDVQPTLYNHPCLHVFPTNRHPLARQRNPFSFSLESPCPHFALVYQDCDGFDGVDMSIAGLSSLPTYMIPYNTNADISPAPLLLS